MVAFHGCHTHLPTPSLPPTLHPFVHPAKSLGIDFESTRQRLLSLFDPERTPPSFPQPPYQASMAAVHGFYSPYGAPTTTFNGCHSPYATSMTAYHHPHNSSSATEDRLEPTLSSTLTALTTSSSSIHSHHVDDEVHNDTTKELVPLGMLELSSEVPPLSIPHAAAQAIWLLPRPVSAPKVSSLLPPLVTNHVAAPRALPEVFRTVRHHYYHSSCNTVPYGSVILHRDASDRFCLRATNRHSLIPTPILIWDPASDPSDANTNSTTLFSDNTDDKSKRSTNPETGKSEQKIGESVAFFTYVKATTLKSNIEESAHVDNSNNTTITTTTTTTTLRMKDMNEACTKHGGNGLKTQKNGEIFGNYSQDDFPSSNSIPNSFSIERSCTPRNGSQDKDRNNNVEDANKRKVATMPSALLGATGTVTQRGIFHSSQTKTSTKKKKKRNE
ncbi:hypothetical protein JHK82_042873 [Glycine max]|nr:hypothetical protein JHK85_043519 [Glycine max]KAG5105903.1 hypothetical protein JHK82_042873 [Glycine max]